MSKQHASRMSVQGIQVLLLDRGPYVEVAERVRAVHRAGKRFSFERGEVLRIHHRWIYRAYITVEGQPYIGDAEIHFGAPSQTPDGTNPITCGQTSAVGNALAFAGFGTLKSILARLGLSPESAMELPAQAPREHIAGIEVIRFDEQPYVEVAERLFVLHQTSKAFGMQQCTLMQHHQVWIYRALITVDGQPYIGDAEICFDATSEPERTYPISCGQTSAVGNALAFAGFGDVRSILERLGQEVPEHLDDPPALASADAVSRARQRTLTSHRAEEPPTAEPRTEAGPQQGQVTMQQRERIRILCERLGESEPAFLTMTQEEAEVFIEELQRSERELLQVLDEDEHTRVLPDDPLVSLSAVGTLKECWLTAFDVRGSRETKRARWAQFKRTICQIEVADSTMLTSQHDRLLAAIIAEEEERRVARTG